MPLDWHHVVLDRVRITLNLLRKTNIVIGSATGDESVLSMLKELQHDIRFHAEGTNLSTERAIAPFLHIVRAQNVSGPFIASAMETILVFSRNKVLLSGNQPFSPLLEDVIDAAANCKFVHTNPVVDLTAELQILVMLRSLVTGPAAPYLTINAIWTLAQFCFSTMLSSSGISRSKSIYEAAESAVMELVSHLMDSACGIPARALEGQAQEVQNNADGSQRTSQMCGFTGPSCVPSEGSSSGERGWAESVSALCALMAYFIDVVSSSAKDLMSLTPASSSIPAPPNGGGGGDAPSRTPSSARSSKHLPPPSPRPSSLPAGSSSTVSPGAASFPKSPSQTQLGMGVAAGGSGSIEGQEGEALHLAFALRTLHTVLLAKGSMDRMKRVIARSPELHALIADDLSLNLLLLCNAKRRSSSSEVMQLLTSMFTTLLIGYASCLRVFVERVMRQVYMKALIQVADWFGEQVALNDGDGGYPFQFNTSIPAGIASSGSVSEKLDSSAGGTVGSGRKSGATAADKFRTENLEIILESLCDVIADIGTLPSLFLSFDCSPTDVDVVQPLVEYLCRSCCLVLTHSSELMTGPAKESGILVIQAFKQLSKTLSTRMAQRERLQSAAGISSRYPCSPAQGSESAVAVLNDTDIMTPQTLAGVIKACRKSKYVLCEASRLFEQKPERGLAYLQSIGALPKPLTADSVAMFLRVAQDLPKECVGSYLGELGAPDEHAAAAGGLSHESKGRNFHSLVLRKYVESFSFEGMPLLDCLRIFLSAFRLPGEAQQIDRILVAFSEYCHAYSVDSTSGILENSEVTYLLSFSIIMLNTDRHNPNIRDDRRMTMEQFVRNNTNYGRDVNQTVPIVREYLEKIFASIDSCPIRTERNSVISSFITSEEWMDLQMQATADPHRTIFVTTRDDASFVGAFLQRRLPTAHSVDMSADGSTESARSSAADSACSTGAECASRCLRSAAASRQVDAAFVTQRLLTAKKESTSFLNPLELSIAVRGMDWLLDEDLMGCVWRNLLRVSTCVHIHHFLLMRNTVRLDASFDQEQLARDRNQQLKRGQLRRLLDISNEFLFELLDVCSGYGLCHVIDCASLALVSCSGLMKGELCEKVLKQLLWNPGSSMEGLECLDFLSTQRFGQSALDPFLVLHQFHYFEALRSAMSTALTVVEKHQGSLRCWSTVFCFLGALHDCALLPEDMVLDSEGDWLPRNVRDEFELKLVRHEQQRIASSRPSRAPKPPRQSASLLSFLLFGGDSETGHEDADAAADASSGDADTESGKSPAPVESFEEQLQMSLDSLSARWDAGYDGAGLGVADDASSTLINHTPSNHRSNGSDGNDSSKTKHLPSDVLDLVRVIKDIRRVVSQTGITQLVSSTKFLLEDKLLQFVQSLVCATEVKEKQIIPSDAAAMSAAGWTVPPCNAPQQVNDLGGRAEEGRFLLGEDGGDALPIDTMEEAGPRAALNSSINALDDNECFTKLALNLCNECEYSVSSPQMFSTSCIAWLEMVLVEVALRNRDRFHALWPLLRNHFIRTLSSPASDCAVPLSYVTERRATGLLKISARMLSREHCADNILDLLGGLFAYPTQSSASKSALAGSKVGDRNALRFPPIAMPLLMDLSSQIAAGMWALLTLNVDLLPTLPLEQWQTLFTVISITAAANSFAAAKSFEVMAWLLHEPRLVAKVPVFCIIGVQPLLRNKAAPLSVSIGAVQLLSHLHSRLEVLIKEEDTDDSSYDRCDYDDSSYGDAAPMLWESCWMPILKALAKGAKDDRLPVRDASASAMCQAILDKHARAVPAAVLMDVLGGVFTTMLLQLADGVLAAVNKELPSSVPPVPLSAELESSSFVQHSLVEGAAARRISWPAWASEEVEVNILENCLSTLCKAFISNLKKLSAYPSFDKLWLRLLFVLGFFIDECALLGQRLWVLDSKHGGGRAIGDTHDDESFKRSCSCLSTLPVVAKTQLVLMADSLKQEGVFDARPGLLTVSRDYVHQLGDGEGLAF